jgi:hypothetical protein
MSADYVIDQEFRGIRQYESGNLIDHHQYEPEGKQSAARAHQFPDFGPDGPQALDLERFWGCFGWRTQSTV